MATQGHEVVRVSQLKLITDEVQAELDNKSNIDHTHVMDNITDLPEWTKESTKPTYTAEEVGAAPASHTHGTATQSSAGFMSASDKIKLDNLDTSGGGSIGAGDVGTTELANYSVTNIKLASNAVTADKIASGAVDTAELASGAVTSAKLDTSVSNDIAQGVQAYEMIQDGFPRYYYAFTQRSVGGGVMYGGYTVVPSIKLVLVQCYCENAGFSGTTQYNFSPNISSTYRPNTHKVAFVTRAGDQNILFEISTAGRVTFYATGTCTGSGGGTIIYFYGSEAN